MDERSSRPRAVVMRGEINGSTWEVARRPGPVPARLRPHVRDYLGYDERTPTALLRRELPGPIVPLILELGPPIRVGDDPGSGRHRGGFAAGLHAGATLTEHAGWQRGVQVNLTPIGARRFFGRPMSELTSRVVAIPDLFPREQGRVCERMGQERDWDGCFDVLEAWLDARFAASTLDLRVTDHAVHRIVEASGAVDVRALAGELGYSHEHVIRLFHDHVGLPPKLFARVVRFDALMQRVRGVAAPPWARLAQELGFYDQGHLAREVKALAGVTPTTVLGEIVTLPGVA